MQAAGSSGKFRCGFPNIPDKKRPGRLSACPNRENIFEYFKREIIFSLPQIDYAVLLHISIPFFAVNFDTDKGERN
jgi:hypothetical protein